MRNNIAKVTHSERDANLKLTLSRMDAAAVRVAKVHIQAFG